MASWIEQLKADVEKENGKKPPVATLASVVMNQAGAFADARSVIVRRIMDDGRLLVVSDARSEKNAQLKMNPSTAIVFWLSKLRKQYRLNGRIEILSGASVDLHRVQAWNELSDSARALFFWPQPGVAIQEEDVFAKEVLATVSIPACFEVLLIQPDSVDILDLTTHPHRRTKWQMQSGSWHELPVNP